MTWPLPKHLKHLITLLLEVELAGALALDDVGRADFSTFVEASDFSVALERSLALELELGANIPRPKSNFAVFGALDDTLELKVECLVGLASSCNCRSAFYAMCTSSTTLL